MPFESEQNSNPPAEAGPEITSASGAKPSAPSVRDTISRLLQSGAISQAQIAREVDLSGATVSDWLHGKYKGSNQSVEDKLAAWLRHRDDRAGSVALLPASPKFVSTDSARRMLAACSYAHTMTDVAVIVAESGCGKTTTLQHYAEGRPAVWRVEMTKAHRRICAALERILRVLGATGGLTQREGALHDGIMRRVSGSGGLLIIDEAQQLEYETLEAIRAIHDQGRIGLVLAGSASVMTRMSGGARQAEFAQLFSRIGKKVKIMRPAAEDVERLADAWKVKGSAERKFLMEIAARPGALRMMTKVLRLASVHAQAGSVDLLGLKHAAAELEG